MDKAYNVYWSQTALDELSNKHKRENVYWRQK